MPFTRPPPPQKRFVFGSVLCFCALWFGFLGLSCCVVVLQKHCDLKASVPVPTTIQEGGRGPTAGMLGQKVTARAQEHKGGGIDRWWKVRAWVGCVRRAAQFASSVLPSADASAPQGSHVGRELKQARFHPSASA